MLTTARRLLIGAAVLATVAGCADADESARDAVTSFYADIEAADGSAACDLLAPETRRELEKAGAPCAQAVLADVAPVTGTPELEVFGDGALARVGADTVFLAHFEQGWLVTAAGCSGVRAGDQPYDCTVQGG